MDHLDGSTPLMHLIHVRLSTPDAQPLPEGTPMLLMAQATPEERLEHVSIHQIQLARPTLGFFLATAGVRQAERAALRITRCALCTEPFLGFSIESCEAALVPSWYDRLLAVTPTEEEV